jgi:solute carrier family 25 protein 14/30
MMTNIFCGVIAGVVSSAIANPTDVLKVRMQACSTSLQQKSMFECFGDVYRQEGISGLWRVCNTSFCNYLF